MKRYNVGGESKAVCEDCGSLVTTKFAYRDVPFDVGIGIAKNILAGVCVLCDSVVTVPAQSTPELVNSRRVAENAAGVLPNATELVKAPAKTTRAAAEGDIPI